MTHALVVVAILATVPQPRLPAARDGLLFGGIGMGPFAAIDDPAAAARWQEVEARARRIRSKLRPAPGRGGEWKMVMAKREAYESLLFAVGTSVSPSRDQAHDDVWIQEEAVAFVEGLRPCYEWEGSSACPQKEAEFAEYWLKWNRTGAFRDFLPLFAGHRWTCAAEALEFEKKSSEAASARERSRKLVAQGLRSQDPLMRYLARELQKDGRCFPEP